MIKGQKDIYKVSCNNSIARAMSSFSNSWSLPVSSYVLVGRLLASKNKRRPIQATNSWFITCWHNVVIFFAFILVRFSFLFFVPVENNFIKTGSRMIGWDSSDFIYSRNNVCWKQAASGNSIDWKLFLQSSQWILFNHPTIQGQFIKWLCSCIDRLYLQCMLYAADNVTHATC